MNLKERIEKEFEERFGYWRYKGDEEALTSFIESFCQTLLEEKWKEIATYKRLSEDKIDQEWNAALSKAQQILKI